MDTIESKTRFIQNYLNNDKLSKTNREYLQKLKNISNCVYSKFEELNSKFCNTVENAKRRIKNQININKSMI